MSVPFVLVLYYSRQGATEAMAQQIARGVELVEGVGARVRTVPAISANTAQSEDEIPASGPLYCENEELRDCSGLVLGSKYWFFFIASCM